MPALPPDTEPPVRDHLADEDFDDFFRSFYPRAVVHVLKHGYDRETAIVAAQDAMWAAYQHWTSIKYPRAWIKAVAVRKALEQWQGQRQRQDREHLVAEFSDEQFGTRHPAAENNWEQLTGLLAGLPATQRKFLFLSVTGYTPEDIAAELGTTSEAVRSSLRRARTTIRRRIAESPTMATTDTG